MRRRLEQRRTRGAEKPPGLNLVSLMDIFTILVFFLMVNANEVEILETSTAIKLPDSVSEDAPEDRVSIEVSHDELIVQGISIASIKDVMASDTQNIEPLIAALAEARLESDLKTSSGKVTIMGDKGLPYDLLKRVMLSCQTANYTHIALAVNQVSGEAAS